MMDQIEVDIISDVCPGHIHVMSPCWMSGHGGQVKTRFLQIPVFCKSLVRLLGTEKFRFITSLPREL